MLLEVKQVNRKTGQYKIWAFCTHEDFGKFYVKDAENKIVFVRYHLCDKDGRPLKTYDVTSKQIDNCTWKEAKPDEKILDTAMKKWMETWTFEVKSIK